MTERTRFFPETIELRYLLPVKLPFTIDVFIVHSTKLLNSILYLISYIRENDLLYYLLL